MTAVVILEPLASFFSAGKINKIPFQGLRTDVGVFLQRSWRGGREKEGLCRWVARGGGLMPRCARIFTFLWRKIQAAKNREKLFAAEIPFVVV